MGKLAKEIAHFMWGYDYYEVMDSYGGFEECVMATENDLKRKDSRKGIADYLKEVAEYSELFADRIMAARLYRKVVTL